MSSSRRRLLAAGVAAGLLTLLPGCGFRPLYGSGQGTAASLEQVAIATIPDRPGQILRNLLIDRFHHDGQPARAVYRLDARITSSEQKVAVRQDASPQRVQLLLTVPFKLVETATGRTVLEGNSRSFVPYNVLEERFAGLVVAEDAYERGLGEISEDITARVAMFLARGS